MENGTNTGATAISPYRQLQKLLQGHFKIRKSKIYMNIGILSWRFVWHANKFGGWKNYKRAIQLSRQSQLPLPYTWVSLLILSDSKYARAEVKRYPCHGKLSQVFGRVAPPWWLCADGGPESTYPTSPPLFSTAPSTNQPRPSLVNETIQILTTQRWNWCDLR